MGVALPLRVGFDAGLVGVFFGVSVEGSCLTAGLVLTGSDRFGFALPK
jgi:hypothetical protein